MPEKADPDRRLHPAKEDTPSVRETSKAIADGPATGYVELRCKSNFSFLRGASHPEELVDRAAELRHEAIGIADINSLAGVVRAHCAAKAAGIKLLVGAEIQPDDGPPISLYAMNRNGYGRLSRLITAGRLRAAKGECRLTVEDILEHSDNLIGIVYGDTEEISAYREAFDNRLYLGTSVHNQQDDEARRDQIANLSKQTHIPLVAVNDVHYHDESRRFLQDVLVCVREHCTLTDAGSLLFANSERYLKSGDEMARFFYKYPDAIRRTLEIADRCNFSLDELRYEYPAELCPDGKSAAEHLSELTWAGAAGRYDGQVPEKVRTLVEHELRLIAELQYEPYFLTVWDIVSFARSRGILCQGRGSAANSAVCFCLGITSVDPNRIDMLFERFVSAERNEPPDIDVDFEHERREEVIQYIYDKYGRDRAGIAAEVITYRPRSAVRDVGKALGLSLDRVDAIAKKVEWWGSPQEMEEYIAAAGLDPQDYTVRCMVKLSQQILGFPRHLSQHVGGFVITAGPLCELVPIENAAMPDRTFIEWDKDDIDALGILKIDCLSLGMLTAIRKAFSFIAERPIHGMPPSPNFASKDANDQLATVPAEDKSVYDMICRADTVGVFQIESRAQMSMLPRLKPRCFYDLVIEVAIVRPGPIQGGMVHPYLRRRNEEEPVEYPNEAIKDVLAKTLGVPIFQEQVMKLAVVAAGFTPGEADRLRRSMAAWRRSGTLVEFRAKLINGMLANNLSQEFAEQVFNQIRGFAEYGFPESHAASFALLVYVSSWLKRYEPAAFTAAVLNSLPMGFYAPAQLVRDAANHGVRVRGVDINHSNYDCTLEGGGRPAWDPDCPPEKWGDKGPTLRLGMRLIKGITKAGAAGIENARRESPFRSIADLRRRTGLNHGDLARLAAADAFRSMGMERRQAVWSALVVEDDLPLFAGLEAEEPKAPLPQMHLSEQIADDYQSIGLSLRAHPISLVRRELTELGVSTAQIVNNTPNGRPVKVAGLVLVRQRPATASGVVFMTLEDETAIANLILWPKVYERFKAVAKGSVALVATGPIERQGEVVHVKVTKLEPISDLLPQIRAKSRDFH